MYGYSFLFDRFFIWIIIIHYFLMASNVLVKRRSVPYWKWFDQRWHKLTYKYDFWGDALLLTTYILNHVISRPIFSTPYELRKDAKINLEHLQPWCSIGNIHRTSHKYENLDCRANKHIFFRYSKSSKCHVIYDEHPNGTMMQTKSHDITISPEKRAKSLSV